MKARLCLILLALPLCQCRYPHPERLGPIPVSAHDQRWGGVQPGDTLILLSERHAVEGFYLKKHPEPGALVMSAGMRLTIDSAGPSWGGAPPGNIVRLSQGRRGFYLPLPPTGKGPMFSPAILKAERIAIEPGPPKPKPIWAR
jgi:hypothetical protein